MSEERASRCIKVLISVHHYHHLYGTTAYHSLFHSSVGSCYVLELAPAEVVIYFPLIVCLNVRVLQLVPAKNLLHPSVRSNNQGKKDLESKLREAGITGKHDARTLLHAPREVLHGGQQVLLHQRGAIPAAS